MTARFAPERWSAPLDRWSRHTRLARWAVAVASAVAVAIVVSFAVLAAAYAVGGWAAIDDTWVGFLAVVSLLAGLVASLVALVLAVVARMRHERWKLLWLPQLLFPAIVVFLVLGEMFLWE